ncbi:MAG: phosphoribosyl-ATP diphosphatase [Casimicrobiaceae bacterium]|nr:phosphoribosyl-ATP diphosphatase [Casimicrobiaceae bacterium]MCX8099164.1 phosphoribosyl-ATP diphosphatase [Casimicrobiaceae bacterium]MDW8312603.1 phosphoribosyl-ATP diphosphatase [Burkholderiales bacterium]
MDADPESSQERLAVLDRLSRRIAERRGGDPATSYVAQLAAKGEDAVLKKVAEETAEFIMAAKDVRYGGHRDRLVAEAADVWFHMLIALSAYGAGAAEVAAELGRREGVSGLAEKAARGG